MKKDNFILWFKDINIKDISIVGGKNASLGEMYNKLRKKGIKIPNGFTVTAKAYDYFIEESKLDNKIRKILKNLDTNKINNLSSKGHQIRQAILQADLPNSLKKEIIFAYKKLSKKYKRKNLDVAVRSSATAEDLPNASFAGQQESYLNIKGEYDLLDACKKCIASLFTNRAISYRYDKGFSHFDVKLSITVQKMVRSDKSYSGVMFSIDTETGFKNAILINASYGLGEYIVKGVVNPDEYYVFKPTLKKGFKPIISKRLGSKKQKLIYSFGGSKKTKNISTSLYEQNKFVLKDNEILKLAKWAIQIEDHYKKPMDIEWAKDSLDKKLYIVQARPETVRSQEDKTVLYEYILEDKGEILINGSSVGERIGQGKANIIKDVSSIDRFNKGEVLVTEMTDPDWEPIMKKAAAIVTNSGGRTCHAAIISRELGIPCIVGTKNGTDIIKQNQNITVSCASGEEGKVYKGLLNFRIDKFDLKNIPKTKTKIMMNIGNPEMAMSQSFIPNEGVGLAREEFIISNYIKIHPLALINFNKLKNKETKDKINELTSSYRSKKEYFVDKLAEGIARITASFYPKEVIVRLTDFKSNEYSNLIGGKEFEPKESNPMIGWRGASRYYDINYLAAFKLECKALLKVRKVMGLKNLKIMIPFCRTIKEAKKVLKILEKYGLKRGKEGLEIYVMCEIPSNIILADEFAKIFDGFSIGSNDLTQLVLGVDRDSELVSHIYDERNEAVKKFIHQVIKVAKKYKRKIGICGQAPSDFPDFTKFLVKEKINSISLNPDTVIKTILIINKAEKNIK